MRNEEALRKQIRTAMERRLSSITEHPDSQQRLLRLLQEKETPVRRKISAGFVLVLALLAATMVAAMATGGFGLLDLKPNPGGNPAFVEHIMPIGQAYENQYLSLTVNEAVTNSTTLSFTMDMAAKDNADPVYVIPSITAEIHGQTMTAVPESTLGRFSDSGFWLPEMDPHIANETQFGVEATLIGLQDEARNYALAADDVTWRLSFEILHPNYPISYVKLTLPAAESDGLLTDEVDERYDALFARAYTKHRILLAPDGSLLNYIVQLPQPDGIAGGEKSWGELQTVLEQSDAFSIVDCPVITFSTAGAAP